MIDITFKEEPIPWPLLEPKIQAMHGIIYLTLRFGVAPGIKIQESSFSLTIGQIDPDRANEFLAALRKVVTEFSDEIPF